MKKGNKRRIIRKWRCFTQAINKIFGDKTVCFLFLSDGFLVILFCHLHRYYFNCVNAGGSIFSSSFMRYI